MSCSVVFGKSVTLCFTFLNVARLTERLTEHIGSILRPYSDTLKVSDPRLRLHRGGSKTFLHSFLRVPCTFQTPDTSIKLQESCLVRLNELIFNFGCAENNTVYAYSLCIQFIKTNLTTLITQQYGLCVLWYTWSKRSKTVDYFNLHYNSISNLLRITLKFYIN